MWSVRFRVRSGTHEGRRSADAWRWWTSTRGSAWQSMRRASTARSTCWTSWENSLQNEGFRPYLRSDNGSEFTADAVRDWLGRRGREDALHRARESLGEWIRGVVQRKASRRVAKRRDLLHASRGPRSSPSGGAGEYNHFRPHSSLGYRPPAPEAVQWPAASRLGPERGLA